MPQTYIWILSEGFVDRRSQLAKRGRDTTLLCSIHGETQIFCLQSRFGQPTYKYNPCYVTYFAANPPS